ncbi:MAG: YbbR-like domain-containing protein [Desulfuromonadales bacterium]|nr:YbbR-like domain-containing protein [Desulfuromonadales bacterium]
MFEKWTENWILKLVSLAFAVVLWFFVIGERNLEVSYIVPLEYQGLSKNLIIANEVPSSVSVRIAGPRALLMHHTAGDVSIAVDLKELPAGVTSFKRLEESLNIPTGLKVTRISPSYVDVKLEHIREKSVPVRVVLSGKPVEGYKVTKTRVEPEQIAVFGAGSELKAVSEVVTESIDLTGVQESFSQTAPIDYVGNYTYLEKQKTVEVEVLLAPDPDFPAAKEPKTETQGGASEK